MSMISVHQICGITVKHTNANWIELIFKSAYADQPATGITLHFSDSDNRSAWAEMMVLELAAAIEKLRPLSEPIHLLNSEPEDAA